MVIYEGELVCKNCLKALGITAKPMISDGYLFALRCTLSGDFKQPNGNLTPHITDAKLFKKFKIAEGHNSIHVFRNMSGNIITYPEYHKLTKEERATYISTRIQNTKFEVVKIRLEIVSEKS